MPAACSGVASMIGSLQQPPLSSTKLHNFSHGTLLPQLHFNHNNHFKPCSKVSFHETIFGKSSSSSSSSPSSLPKRIGGKFSLSLSLYSIFFNILLPSLLIVSNN